MNKKSKKNSSINYSITITITIILSIVVLTTPLCSANNSSNTSEHTNENTTTENNTTHNETTCDNFSILMNDKIYTHEEKISYTFTGFKEGDNVTYWIEDLFGEIWKKEYTSANNNKKTYTPKIEEKDRVLILKANRTRTNCEDAITEKIIIIKKDVVEEGEENTTTENNTTHNETIEHNETTELEHEEDINIQYYDEEVQSGKKMRIELLVQKNSNRNNAFYVWIENEEEKKSGEIKINMHQKGRYEIEIEYPLRLEKCGNAFEKNYVHFSGLGKEKEEKIYVLQEPCPEEEKERCAELIIENDIVLEENPISSLYVRSKKWQENISLYSSVKEDVEVFVFGPIAQQKNLETGTNSISISPKVGNNTYALITKNGKGKLLDFYLEGEETEENKIAQTQSIPIQTTYIFSTASNTTKTKTETKKEENTGTNQITGEIIYTTKEKKNMPILGGIILISIIGLFIQWKRKVLRSKKHSEKTLWQRKKKSAKKTSKKKLMKDTYTQTSSLK